MVKATRRFFSFLVIKFPISYLSMALRVRSLPIICPVPTVLSSVYFEYTPVELEPSLLERILSLQ